MSYKFIDCSGLTAVYFGDAVAYFGGEIFKDCKNLKKVVCNANKVPKAYYNIFEGFDVKSATLYVPETSIDAYKNSIDWSQFGSIKAIDPADAIAGLKASADNGPIFDLQGRQLKSAPQKGIYIQDGKKVLAK